MRRAGVRAPLRGERQPACGRPGGGRWLTGFKDLWLTGPLTAPKGREKQRGVFSRAGAARGRVAGVPLVVVLTPPRAPHCGGGGGGGGCGRDYQHVLSPPSLSLPHKGGGNAV